MKFIKLTMHTLGEPIYVNTQHILTIDRRNNNYTTIGLYTKDDSLSVNETPEEILAMINDSKDAPSDDGWIDWHSGDCPVSPDASVEYVCRGGFTDTRLASSLSWYYFDNDGDIMKYRVVK